MTCVTVKAEDLSDFSNNLATDLGPLLMLFGDSITKQYLSESTSFIDYFIFAMAPIGIITAIVSVIRVCGHSALRAFIGRSQEGDGVVEAELCTSTSRDVCELFNRGGITRVLGRPNILELIHVPKGKHSHDSGSDSPREELFLFQDYLNHGTGDPDASTSEWKKSRKDQNVLFAPKPNLSLNVGIVKPPDWVFFVVAAVGFVLQAGILSLAGVGVWFLRWDLNDGKSSASTNYAPTMFIGGSVLMCFGIWACAALIGQTTQEVRYKRVLPGSSGKSTNSDPTSRLIWLQHGSQVIGDQTFDPYAYLEKTDDPLRVWTSSRKDFEPKFEFYTTVAVLCALVGYIAQFIGLRGLKSWVSLAQLGASIVMSILRGALRTQRLARKDNELRDMPDMVTGHELDWLAYEIGQPDSKDGHFWHVTGRNVRATEMATPTQFASPETKSIQLDDGVCPISPSSSSLPNNEIGPRNSNFGCNQLYALRVRLARLTSDLPLQTSSIGDYDFQKWQAGNFEVRAAADKLSTALCLAAEKLFKSKTRNAITLRIEAVSTPRVDEASFEKQLISVDLEPPRPDSPQSSWTTKYGQLEAILGLWMWGLVSDNRISKRDDSGHLHSDFEKVSRARIISAGDDNKQWEAESNKQGEMDLWLGHRAVTFSEAILTLNKQDLYGLVHLWAKRDGNWELLPKSVAEGMREGSEDRKALETKSFRGKYDHQNFLGVGSPLKTWRRFCGWNPVYEALSRKNVLSTDSRASAESSSRQEIKLRVQLAPTNDGLLTICTQEVFAALAVYMETMIALDDVMVVESGGEVRLSNSTVGALVEAFVEADLGSNVDAILCLVPAFGKRLRNPSPKEVLDAATKGVENYRRQGEWERAEILMRWACKRFVQEDDEMDPPDMTINSDSDSLVETVILSTAELYRWSLAQGSEDNITFGIRGIAWLTETHEGAASRDRKLKNIFAWYQSVAKKFQDSLTTKVAGQHHMDGIQGPAETRRALMTAIKEGNKEEALYQLCFVSTGDLAFQDLQPALPLAVRNDWGEVVSSLLEMKADRNYQDHNGRNAVSHCAEHGYIAYLKLFMRLGAHIDQPDRDGRSPLHWAAKAGQLEVAKILMKTRQVEHNRRDVKRKMPLFYAAEGGYQELFEFLLSDCAESDLTDDARYSILLAAAGGGYEGIAKQVLENGPSLVSSVAVRYRHNDADVLQLAAEKGRAGMVRLLLEKGFKIESTRSFLRDKSAITLAAKNGHADIIEILLEYGAKIESKSEHDGTPLSCAAANGHEAVVKMLLARGAKLEPNRSMMEYSLSPLSGAAQGGHEDIVRLLIEEGAEIEPQKASEELGTHAPLYYAADKGREAIVKLLLDKGAKVDPADGEKETPLYAACDSGHAAVAKLLLENGAAINGNGDSPLVGAVLGGHEAIIRHLIEEGADIDCSSSSMSALSWAAHRGKENLVKLLLDEGASLESGKPLIEASEHGNESTVKLLLERGAKVDAIDHNGRTSLSLVAWQQYTTKPPTVFESMAKLLLENGAEVESRDNEGRTPLSHAAESGNVAMVQLFLQAGADSNTTDNDGKKPRDYADVKPMMDFLDEHTQGSQK
jgi:ankyrin repeat protein